MRLYFAAPRHSLNSKEEVRGGGEVGGRTDVEKPTLHRGK